jgi:hypothetical protein
MLMLRDLGPARWQGFFMRAKEKRPRFYQGRKVSEYRYSATRT